MLRLLACVPVAAIGLAASPLPRVDDLVLDGALADWAGRGLAVDPLTPDSSPSPDPARSHAVARFGWDSRGLLVAVEVVDATPRESHRASGAYLADSVELFLAPDPARGESVQFLVSPGTARGTATPRVFAYDHRSPASAPLAPPSCEWAVRARPDGYTIEARLPWSLLGRTPAPGDTIASRLFVNDLDSRGGKVRYAWAPSASSLRFHPLTLAEGAAAVATPPAVAWVAPDLSAPGLRLHLRATATAAGDFPRWTLLHPGMGPQTLQLDQRGPVADASVLLPPGLPDGRFTLAPATGEAPVLSLGASPAAEAATLLRRANFGWRETPAAKAGLAFARLEFCEHVFAGAEFPAPAFRDPAAVARLLGTLPVPRVTWLDADGRQVSRADRPGLYGARTEVPLPGLRAPLVFEHLLYRLPDACPSFPRDTEHSARVLGLALSGADATETHAARVAERWWHRARGLHQWSQPLRFALRVPAGASDGRPLPLLVYLHGSGQDGETDAERRADELATLAGPGVIVLCPRSPGAWRGPAVGELIDRVATEHPVDPARIYLMGFSMGGIGTWEVALDQPERFAALVPIGGRAGSPSDAARLGALPIWAINGAEDPTTTPEEAEMMVAAVNRSGGSARLTLLPGLAHGDSQPAAHRLPGLWEWLRAQSRPAVAP